MRFYQKIRIKLNCKNMRKNNQKLLTKFEMSYINDRIINYIKASLSISKS